MVLQITCVQPFTSGQPSTCLDGYEQFPSPSGHAESLEDVGASSLLGISPTSTAGAAVAFLQLQVELHWSCNGPWCWASNLRRYLTHGIRLLAPYEAYFHAEAGLQQCWRDSSPSPRPWSHPTHPGLALVLLSSTPVTFQTRTMGDKPSTSGNIEGKVGFP